MQASEEDMKAACAEDDRLDSVESQRLQSLLLTLSSAVDRAQAPDWDERANS